MTQKDDDPLFQNEVIDRQILVKPHEQNQTPLPTVAIIAVRGQVSNRIAAAIATATLIVGIKPITQMAAS